MLLKGCLNGTRSRSEHPACPITPDQLARDAAALVAAGVAALHIHPRDENGRETFDARHLGEAMSAIRAVTAAPIGVSTGAWFLPEVRARLLAIERWEVLPDFASVNFHEDGAMEVAGLLLDRGIGVEAGLWHERAVVSFASSGLADRCVRVLYEPMEQSIEDALRNLSAMERRMSDVTVAVHRPR